MSSSPLIISLKGAEDTDRKIIDVRTDASLDSIRSQAAEKLGLICSLDDLSFEGPDGKPLDSSVPICDQKQVSVVVKDHITDVIPGPPRLPFVGHLHYLLPDMTAGFLKIFNDYGRLIDISILGKRIVSTNDPEIAEVFVKESEYFTKKVTNALMEIKSFAGQGLFTTDTDEDDWKLAHKLLMPAFSPRAIKAYQEEMGLIAQQTIKVLEQYHSDEKVDILNWTTNLTFETIGRIGFGFDFKLLDDRDAPEHPFIKAMGYCLRQSITRFQQVELMKRLPLEANRRFDREIQRMRDIVDEVIKERKQSTEQADDKDLLGFMLTARDEQNNGLSDENIRDQVVTFLIAGHDTTANTLAWTLYELSRQPKLEAKVLQEIADAGITHDALPVPEQINKLKYMHQCLKETLRMHPPVRALSKYCKKDCVVPGGFRIKADTSVSVNLYAMHHNSSVYPDPERYDPNRWSPEEEQKRSRFAWLPFSTGPRACIGMAFALQEAKTVLAMFLHRFKFKYDGPPVQYDPKQATTKPLNLFMTIEERTDMPEPSIPSTLGGDDKDAESDGTRTPTKDSQPKAMPTLESSRVGSVELPPVTFLYGTQTGTAHDYASQLANQAKGFGFQDVTTCEMDQWKVLQTGKYDGPKGPDDPRELVVVCTATYNGQPPDNAEKFDQFLDKSKGIDDKDQVLDGMMYAVFGLGNKNWRTYQAFPTKIDARLEEMGAERFFTAGQGDADQDIDAEFNDWCAHFWTCVLGYYGLSLSNDQSVVPSASQENESTIVKVHFCPPHDAEKQELAAANFSGELASTVLVNKELQQPTSQRSTRHIELDITNLKPLRDSGYYEAGDHLEIFPENSQEAVEAIALGFGLILDAVFEVDQDSLSGVSPRSLAASIHGPCTVANALRYHADLLSPPSRRMLGYFASQLRTVAPDTAIVFDRLTMPDDDGKDQYPAFISKYRTLLDLQKGFPQVKRLDIAQFLAAVGVMQPRRYSIASSPKLHPKQAHLAVGVVDDLVNGKHYPGLSSSYLSRVKVSDIDSTSSLIRAQLKSSKSTFSMPSDPKTPIIMIAAGTGVSPFRGFLQERAYQIKQGQSVGPTVLFFGCRCMNEDYIYREEMETYVKDGVITSLHVAFSRQEPVSPRKYVQHQLLLQASEVWNLLDASSGKQPASVYICGSGAMSRDVRGAFVTMIKSFGKASTDDEAEAYMQTLTDEERYNEDVWG